MRKFFIILVFVIAVLLGCSQKKGDFYIEPIRGNSAFLVNNTQRTARFDLIAGGHVGIISMSDRTKTLEQFDVYIIPLELKEDQIVEITDHRWHLILRPGDKFVIISDGFNKDLYKNYNEVDFFMAGKFFDEQEAIRIVLYKWLKF
jgi:hypothetical protein